MLTFWEPWRSPASKELSESLPSCTGVKLLKKHIYIYIYVFTLLILPRSPSVKRGKMQIEGAFEGCKDDEGSPRKKMRSDDRRLSSLVLQGHSALVDLLRSHKKDSRTSGPVGCWRRVSSEADFADDGNVVKRRPATAVARMQQINQANNQQQIGQMADSECRGRYNNAGADPTTGGIVC